MDSAEAAPERTANAGMVNRSALAEERRPQVLLRRARDETASRGKRPGPSSPARDCGGARRRRLCKTGRGYRARFARPTQCVQQLEQRIFALPANRVVHILCIQRRVRVGGREVAAPDDRNVWTKRRISRLASMAAAICGPGMQVTPSISTRILVDQPEYARSRIVLDIAIDDAVLLPAFQNGGQRQHGQGKPAVARSVARGLNKTIICQPRQRRFESARARACPSSFAIKRTHRPTQSVKRRVTSPSKAEMRRSKVGQPLDPSGTPG